MAMQYPLWSISSESYHSSSYESSSSGEDTGDHLDGSKIDFSYRDLDSDLVEANLQDTVENQER